MARDVLVVRVHVIANVPSHFTILHMHVAQAHDTRMRTGMEHGARGFVEKFSSRIYQIQTFRKSRISQRDFCWSQTNYNRQNHPATLNFLHAKFYCTMNQNAYEHLRLKQISIWWEVVVAVLARDSFQLNGSAVVHDIQVFQLSFFSWFGAVIWMPNGCQVKFKRTPVFAGSIFLYAMEH